MCAEGEEHMCDKGMTGTYDGKVKVMALGKLGPGQLGPRQLGPGAQLSGAQFA